MLRGKKEIPEFWRDVCRRDFAHRVENEVIGEELVAFNQACEYLEGIRVLSAMTLEVQDGKITLQVDVEAWDE